tara:strand:- start:643 stop:1194 length:552 start_codon:yes stop_codon:yes gene_type:complete
MNIDKDIQRELNNKSSNDWFKEAPKISYNPALKKPVLVNNEAFYLVALACKHEDVLHGGVTFEMDDHFRSYFYKCTGNKNPSNLEINLFVLKLVKAAMEDEKWLEEDSQGVFLVSKYNLQGSHADKHQTDIGIRKINSKTDKQMKEGGGVKQLTADEKWAKKNLQKDGRPKPIIFDSKGNPTE